MRPFSVDGLCGSAGVQRRTLTPVTYCLCLKEHHLQRAISAQQVFREKKENMVIPVPEAETNTTYYDRLYKGEVKVPKQLIHIQRENSSVYMCSHTCSHLQFQQVF